MSTERIRQAIGALELAFPPEFLSTFAHELEADQELFNEANRRVRSIAEGILNGLEDPSKRKRPRVGDDQDQQQEVNVEPFDPLLTRSVDVLTKQMESKNFKDFYNDLREKIREGKIVGDYSRALDKILRENMKSIAALSDGEHRLSFCEDGKLIPDESYGLTRGVRGWTKWAFNYTSRDDNITNLKVFADFVCHYFLNRTQNAVDQTLIDLFNNAMTGLNAMKDKQYNTEKKRNEYLVTQSAIDSFKRVLEHVQKSTPQIKVDEFLLQVALTVSVDASLKEDKNKIVRLATRLEGCLDSILSHPDLSHVKTLFINEKGLSKHKAQLLAAIVLNKNGEFSQINQLCKDINDKRKVYLEVAWLVEEDFQVRDAQVLAQLGLTAFCELIKENQEGEKVLIKKIEEDDPDAIYRVIQNVVLGSAGGIFGILTCLLGNRMPQVLLAGTPYAAQVAGKQFDELLEEVLKQNYFAQGHLPQVKTAITKFREEALQKNPQEGAKQVIEICKQYITMTDTFSKESEKIKDLLKELVRTSESQKAN